MLFNSAEFLLFFPMVTLLYFIIPKKVRYIWLLFASYYFYMCWNEEYALLMATSTIITYLSGLLIEHVRKMEDVVKQKRYAKLCVILSFVLNLSILGVFKYCDFIMDNVTLLLQSIGIEITKPSFSLLLPVGISFYTFQALSYTMDVYRKEIYAERNILKYALFVSFFPQLVAGPIERSKNLLIQINRVNRFDYERMKKGLLLMGWGYFQKLVIADRVAIIVNQVYNNHTEYYGVQLIMATVLFAIQIYCDFSSYSDIAIGAAEILGFKLMQNFKQPYFANSIVDFWKRWHISLTSWFRDYLYIPLGGNRKGKVRQYINIMVVFVTSGLWHGASWHFVVWGGLNGAYQIIGYLLKPFRVATMKLFRIKQGTISHRIFQRMVTFILVCISWVFFRANSLTQALQIFRRMFKQSAIDTMFHKTFLSLGLNYADLVVIILSIGILFVVGLLRRNNVRIRDGLAKQPLVVRWGVYYGIIFTIIIFGIYGPQFDASQFIYFQF